MAARFEPRFLKDRSPAAATEYLRRFRRRHKLSIRRITHRGTKQRSDLEVVAASFGHSMRYAFEHDSAVSFVAGDEKYGQVFNMDQTSIYIDMNPTTTITFRGDRNVDVLQATGAKLCPLIVFSGTPGGPIEEELHAHPLYSKEVFLAVQKKGYCDERVMHIWINEVWRPSVTSSRVLLLDSLKTHKMSSVRTELEDSLSTEVEFIPPGITGLSQPMDVAVMRTFKMHCRSLYVKYHLTHDFCSSAAERRRLITAIVVTAWSQIDPSVIRKGFIKAGLVPVGPREKDGSFRIDAPSKDIDTGDEVDEDEESN
ncbi:hypothetical protein PR001_g31145 [Phytophthora rubi]|uniref:DDE-1 domain-containing protein n=1 Tax=Phytophthora rubi TaxID=129364 RepID=A0A6A3GH15_9STRA|nr:hypothetical protein PR001_g31145 [Phytophthora rubi]